jgi:hypothetical protein
VRELVALHFYGRQESTEVGAILTFSDLERMIEHIEMISKWEEFERFFACVRPLDVRVYGKLSEEAEAWIASITWQVSSANRPARECPFLPSAIRGFLGRVLLSSERKGVCYDSSSTTFSYSSGESRSASSVMRSFMNQPSPYGSSLMFSGASSRAELTSTTSPPTGA